MKKKKNLKKRIIIGSVCAVLIAATVAGLLIARRLSGKALVTSVAMLDMGAYGSGESFSGTIYDSAQQNIFAGADKKVETVFVKEGDSVKKGDELFRYDTTLLELDVEEKQLSVNICETALTKEQNLLTQYQNIVPYVEPVTEAVEETVEDSTETELPEPSDEDVSGDIVEEADTEEHYTAQEKADKIAEQELAVRRAQNALDAAKQDLLEAQESLNNATVTSQLDGKITKIQDPESYDTSSAFCTIIGDSGVTVKGYIGELKRAELKPGDSLYVSSYFTGTGTEAEVLTVNDYPVEGQDGGYYGDGNPNSSYYEFTAFMDDAQGFEVGDSVEVTVMNDDAGSGMITLEKMYVRTDDNGTYVMKDVDGELKRQDVKTVKSGISDYIIVTDGLTYDDYIAFPYGSKAKEGTLTTTEEVFRLF